MRRRILVSLLSLAVICFGVRYAVGREALRRPDHLHTLYQLTNRDFFEGKLQDVVLKVHDLSNEKAEGITYKEGEDIFVIVLDPSWNTSEDKARCTIWHESCHVSTWGKDTDDHGPHFQECMKRFEGEK